MENNAVEIMYEEKTIMDLWELCLRYDMVFSYNPESGIMYVIYTTGKQEEYAQVFFDPSTGHFLEADIEIDGGIEEISSSDYFYQVLEMLRIDNLKMLYVRHGLIEHPSNRMSRRGRYEDTKRLFQLAFKQRCKIDFEADIICIESTRVDQPN